MMITIHGLPPRTTFQAVKVLVKQECNIIDFIMDNLVDDGPNSKKVRIGVSNDAEGYCMIKCLDGFRMSATHMLKVVPVVKALNPPTQNFDHRSGFPNQSRNENPQHSRPDYPNQPINEYGNRGPQAHGPNDSRHSGSLDARHYSAADQRHPDPHGPVARNSGPLRSQDFTPHGIEQRPHGPQDSRHPVMQDSQESAHPPPWGSNVNSSNNQWAPQSQIQAHSNYNQRPTGQTGFGQQHSQGPQDSYNQNRGPPNQGYIQPKPNVPERVVSQRQGSRQHVLRSVEIVDTPNASAARPFQEKPITIMKENFQGPSSQFNNHRQTDHSHFPGQGQPAPWSQKEQQPKPQSFDGRRGPPADKHPDMPKQMPQDFDKRPRFSPQRVRPQSPVRRVSPSRNVSANAGRNYQEPGRRISPTGRPFHASERRVSPVSRLGPSLREFSPSNRRISPTGRRVSPSGRRFSPSGRRFSPSDRRISPSARRISPIGRRVSPNGRRVSPTDRRISPNRRRLISPGRKVSPPGRKVSSPGRRISPSRRVSSPGRGISPSGRRISPSGRRISPPGRRISPPGRRISPPGRRISPPGRRISPPGRRVSPGNRMSPGRRVSPGRISPGRKDEQRRMSPSMMQYNYNLGDARRMGRRESPRRFSPKRGSPTRRLESPTRLRYSPNRHGDKPSDKYMDVDDKPKPVRPAYEPNATQAQKQTYTGYRAAHDTDYPPSAWRPAFAPAASPPARASPRSSRSPRRSWALEKRSPSPPPPPPPAWPGRPWERTERHDEPPPAPARRDDPDPRPFVDIDRDFQEIYSRAVEFRKKAEERKASERRRDEHDEPQRRDKRDEPPRRDKRDEPPRRDKRDEPPRRRSRSRSPAGAGEWNTQDRKRMFLEPSVKAKRDKACEDIANGILDKYDIPGERARVAEELRLALANLFLDMFADRDVAYIELVIKYKAKHGPREDKIMHDVLSRLPSHLRNLKRKAEGPSEVSTKIPRRSPPLEAREEPRPKLSDAVIPDWNINLEPPKVMNLPLAGISGTQQVVNVSPAMVPPPLFVNPQQQLYMQVQQAQYFQQQQHSGNAIQQQQPQFSGNIQQQQLPFDGNTIQQPQFSGISVQQQQSQFMSNMMPPHGFEPVPEQPSEFYNLYLCQDDFEPFSEVQAEYLKNFLVAQIVRASQEAHGWAPDFHLKGLQSSYRYELCTKDEASKDWLQSLDFSEFDYFNVLVYTKEELWYERAAIWLPGHSRSRNIEPLEKIKMQNRHLEGVNVGKWKFVKKIVTTKGTRLYVDMPPSSARALEKHKMMLSYELQKVNVFLKAVAVDKDSFDAGLKEISITDPSLLMTAVQGSPMPTLNANLEPGMVKIGLNGQKSLTVEQARKIKEVVLYFLFKHLRQGNEGRVDFIKYGFCAPAHLGIVPENPESKRWLMNGNFGKLKRNTIVVYGGDDDNTKYFKMIAYIPHEYHTSAQLAFERLKQSNQGIRGIHFNLWKAIKIVNERKKALLELDVDLESVEAIIRMKYQMDYVGEYGIQVVTFKSEYSCTKLEEKIRKCKMEQVDSYDVANMELDSESDKDDVVCLD